MATFQERVAELNAKKAILEAKKKQKKERTPSDALRTIYEERSSRTGDRDTAEAFARTDPNQWVKDVNSVFKGINGAANLRKDEESYWAKTYTSRLEQLREIGKQYRSIYTDPQAVAQIDDIIGSISQGMDYLKNTGWSRRKTQEEQERDAGYAAYDLTAGQKELDDLNAELKRLRMEELARGSGVNGRPYSVEQTEAEDAQYTTGYGIVNSRPYAAGLQVQRQNNTTEDPIRELEEKIAQKQQYFNQAKQYQKIAAYDDTVNNADFDRYDDYIESEDVQYNWINDKQFRNDYEARFQRNGTQSKYGFNHYDRMNASEIAIYNYYYAKSGKEAAQKYLDTIQERLNARTAEDMFSTVRDNVAAELVFGAAAGVNQFGTNVVNNFRFKDDYIPQSAYQIASGMVREDLADDGWKLPDWLGGASLGQVAYDTVTTSANMAPSILVGLATGVPMAGTAMMGLSAAGGAYQQALNEGYDKDQARGYSILVGASEVAMEKLLGGISAVGGNALGINAVKNIANADKALKAIALRIGGSALSEFGEEYLQEVLDPVFSNIMLKTDKEVKLISAEALYSGILGALTGAFMEAPFAIYGETKTASTGRKIKKAGGVNDLAKIGNTFAADTVAYKLAGKVDENTGAYTIGHLFNEIGATLTEQNVGEISEALVKEGVGETEAKKYTKAFAYVVEGGTLPESLVNAIEADTLLAKAARKVLFEDNTTWNQRTQGYNETLRKLAEDKVKREQKGVSKAGTAAANTVDTRKENGTQSSTEPAAEPQAETEKTPGVKEIVSLKNGVMKLRMDDGSEAESSDVSYGSRGEALIYETVAQMTNDVQVANILVDGFHNLNKNSELDAEVYAAGIEEAFRFGKGNIPRKELASSEFASKLSAAKQDYAYRMGQKAAGKQTAREQASVSKEGSAEKTPATGKVHFDRKGRTFDKTREASLKTLEQLPKLLGAEFYVYESYVNKDGQRVYRNADGEEVSAPNGFYDPKTGAIHIDLNAGADGKGTMIFTVAHELTHFIKQWSPAKFKVLANFLVEQYGEKGVSVSELVQRQIDKAKRNGRNLTWDEAYEEMVADSMEAILTDGNVVQMMADLKQQDKTLWQKICDWFKDLTSDLKKLVEAYKGYKPDSPEGKMVADMQDTIVIFESIYADALAEASENFQRAEKNTTEDGGRKYSFGGRNAVTANNSALQQAEQLAEQGVDNETIRQQTGWYKGMDGKWRYEIDDSRMKITDKIINYMQLGELMQHEALYAAYPDLANIDVVFHSLEEGTSGAYNPQFDSIDLSYKLKNDPFGLKDTLVHEIQHAIQQREGFTKGATVKSWERKIKSGFDSRRADEIRQSQETERELRRIQNEDPEFYRDMMELDAMTPDLPRGEVDWDTLEKIEDDPVEWKQYDARREEMEAKYGDIKVWDMNDLLYQRERFAKNAGRSGVELYFDTAGEIEARDASSRRSKTVEQRKSSPPRLGNEDTVFAEENAPADDYIPGIVSEKEITENINAIAGMDSVVSINGDEFKMGDGRLLTDVTDFFNSIGGSVYNSRLGDVFLRKRGVRHDLGHGMSDEKAASFAAIPAVLEHGQVAGFVVNKDGKGFDSATVVAPIKIGKEPYMMGVIVHRSNKENRFYVHDVVAVKEEAAPLITGTHNVGETGGATSTISIIRKILAVKAKQGYSKKKFSDRDPAAGRVNEVLQNENAKLKEDVQYLKDLVKLQKTVTGGTKFTKTSVEAMASNLMKANNVKGNKQELAKLLNGLYEYIAKGEELSWDGVKEMAQPAVDWLKNHTVIKSEISEYAREILHDVRTSRISLDESQIAEAAYRFGSYNDFRKAMMGSVIVSKDGVPLDIQWQEWASTYPDIFDANITASDMPGALADAISSLRNSDLSRAEYAYHADMIEQDLLQQVYDGYWRVSTLYTVADVKQREINSLKGKHRQQMFDLRQFHREKTDQLKREHRDEVKRIRKEYREDSQKKQREIMDRYEESRKRSIENRNKTAMRHKIQNVVKELNSLLLTNDKKRHVPDSLKKAVADALDILNMDTVDAENRAAKYADLIAKEQAKANPDQDKIDAYTVTMENILRQGEKMGQRIKDLKNAYEEIQKSDDPDIANAYDPVIAGAISELAETIGNTPLKNMSMEQLSDVYDVYRMVLNRVRDANKAMADNIKEAISKLAGDTTREIQTVGGSKKYRASLLDPVSKFDWNNLKPVYAMERIGSSTMTKLFDNVRAGEDVWAKDVSEAREYYLERSKKYGYDKWDFDKKYRFESNSGIPFELTLEQILSLYAYSKREQAADHLRLGGFVFDSNIETYREKDGKKSILKYKVNTADAHQITPEIMTDIIGNLTKEQTGFVDEMQDYLSTVMGAKGNEVTSKMYGVKLFKEKFYFPLKSAKQYMFEQNQVAGEVRIKNSGFTNKVVAKANNPVILSNFMDVWSGHVNDMSMYHAFTLPLEDFNRVLNYNSPKRDGVESVSVKGTIQNAYGPAAVSYLSQLITDLNGGARTDSTTGFINKMMGLFKKGAVFASLSVVVQQPSAIARAAALVDTKYFIGPRVDQKRHKYLWEEVKKYAPVAIIKEMGYFDTNMGKSTQDFITGREYSGIKEKAKAAVTDSAYRDELLSKAPALADEYAWCGIWAAVKRETKAKYPDMDSTSEAFLKFAGKRFTEVITKTQVYDSVLARSANMRSKDTGMKMATAFMAEPTTSINMIEDAILKGKRGDRKYARTAIGAVIASQVLNAILVSFVYAGRDDDEDETYWEKYVGSLTGSLVDGINPATYIPFIKDIVSIVQGYDVERSDMAVVSDIWKAIQNLKSDKVSPYRKVENFAGSIAQIFGLPVKNIMRDVRGIYNTIMNLAGAEKTTGAGVKYAISGAITGKTVSNKDQLYEARLAGDEQHEERVAARYDDEDSANAAVRAAIKDRFMADEIDEAAAVKYMVLHAGMDGSEAHWTMDAWKYRKKVGSDEGYGKYAKLHDAVRSGNNLAGVVKEYTDNGVKTSTLTGEITDEFKPVYLDASDSERKSMKAKLINAYVQCGMERDDAHGKLESWDFEAEYGFAYSDRKETYLSGKVSKEKLVDILIDRGYDEESAEAQVEVYEWEDEGFEDVTTSVVRNYNEWCKPAGISKSVYLQFWRFDNSTENDVDKTTGKKIPYSAVKKIMAYINSLNLTKRQKDALAKSAGWSDKTIQKYKLW